uniref:Uncharacterized protein n=1 Tax=Ciona intestinalis TaxID=7719 RepID=H2XMS6_CIOIN
MSKDYFSSLCGCTVEASTRVLFCFSFTTVIQNKKPREQTEEKSVTVTYLRGV